MASEYAKSVPFEGRAGKALSVAQSAFISQGFEIVGRGDSELRVTGPGMNSTRQNPLRGVTEASIVVRSTAIEIRAVLGGVQKLKTFLRVFPLAMAIFFMVVFGVIAWQVPVFRHFWIFLFPLLALSPWLVIAPVMGRAIERRTRQAVDTLLSNMVMLGSAD